MEFPTSPPVTDPMPQISLTPSVKANFLSITSWGKFLGIVGIIMSCILVLVALFMMVAMPMAGALTEMVPGGAGILFGFIYLLVAALYLIPSIMLLQFATKVKTAFVSGDQIMFESGMAQLKNCFAFAGVMAIIVIAFYMIAFFGAIIGSLL